MFIVFSMLLGNFYSWMPNNTTFLNNFSIKNKRISKLSLNFISYKVDKFSP